MPIRRARLATGCIFLLSGVTLGDWATQVPLVRARLGLPAAWLGLALLCVAVGALCAMPLAGRLAGRFGAGRVIRVATLPGCAMVPCAAAAPGFVWLGLALFLFGVGFGTIDVAMNAGAVVLERRAGRPLLSSLHAMWSLGGLLGSAGGGALLLVLRPVPQAALLAVFAAVTMFAAAGYMPRAARAPAAPAGGRPRALWADRRLLLVGALMCASFATEGAMLDWSGIYLRERRGIDPAFAAYGYSAFSLAMMLCRFGGDRAGQLLGDAGLIRGAWLAAAGLALALLAPGVPLALVGFALAGGGLANVVPVLFRIAGQHGGARPEAAVGVAATLGYGGVLAGPPAFGAVASLLGVAGALWLSAGLCGLMALAAAGAARRPA